MIKLLVRLFRRQPGQPAQPNALAPKPETATKLHRAKKALARVSARDRSARRRQVQLEKLIAGLEHSVLAALAKERDDLALNGASAIADLEAECHEAQLAIELAAQRMIRLRATIARTESRLHANASSASSAPIEPKTAHTAAENTASGPRRRASAEEVLTRLNRRAA
jgi:phage shock protein A